MFASSLRNITRLSRSTRQRFISTKKEKDALVQEFLAAIKKDPAIMKRLLKQAGTESIKSDIIRPLASQIGRTLEKEFSQADLDGNKQLSALEVRNWYKMKYPSFGVEGAIAAGTGAREAVTEGGTVAAASTAAVVEEPSSIQLRQLAVMAGIPFIGFGILDNAIMLTAGAQIEATMGVAFGITPLFAAGLGNAVSDVAGLKAGGLIEVMAARLGLPDPGLTAAQLKLPSVKKMSLLAGALGLTIGCLIGMFENPKNEM